MLTLLIAGALLCCRFPRPQCVCLQGIHGRACSVALLMTDDIQVHRASLPQKFSAVSLSCPQTLPAPQILTAQQLEAPAASQTIQAPQERSHTNAHTIMWSAATQRIVIGCNEVKGSSSRCLLRILTVSRQAQQILHDTEAIWDQESGCWASPLIEVSPLLGRKLNLMIICVCDCSLDLCMISRCTIEQGEYYSAHLLTLTAPNDNACVAAFATFLSALRGHAKCVMFYSFLSSIANKVADARVENLFFS